MTSQPAASSPSIPLCSNLSAISTFTIKSHHGGLRGYREKTLAENEVSLLCHRSGILTGNSQERSRRSRLDLRVLRVLRGKQSSNHVDQQSVPQLRFEPRAFGRHDRAGV